MESSCAGGHSVDGSSRAKNIRTRLQTKRAAASEKEREHKMHGLTASQFWDANVKCGADIKIYYELYHPEFPPILVDSIASRISGIVDKSRRGDTLTDEDKGYYYRSKLPSLYWDPAEELKEQETQGRIGLTLKMFESM